MTKLAAIIFPLFVLWLIGCAIVDSRRQPRLLENRLARAVRKYGARSKEAEAALVALESWKRKRLS